MRGSPAYVVQCARASVLVPWQRHSLSVIRKASGAALLWGEVSSTRNSDMSSASPPASSAGSTSTPINAAVRQPTLPSTPSTTPGPSAPSFPSVDDIAARVLQSLLHSVSILRRPPASVVPFSTIPLSAGDGK